MIVDELRRRLYLLAFVDEFGPLYALFTLWFDDNGVSTSQISVVFVLWAVLVVLLEIPSGALADRVDRRRLLAVAFGLRAAGISVWLLVPNFGGMIVGALLWAVHSAFASGAWEALIHDELTAVGAESTYAPVMARVGQFGHLAIAAGALVATPAIGLGAGIEALGWLNVAVHAVSITVVLSLPDVRWVAACEPPAVPGTVAGTGTAGNASPFAAWWSTMRTGVRDARRSPQLLRLIVVGAMLNGLIIFDEYVPLLARQRGASDSVVPIVYVAVWVGLLVGGELTVRRSRLRGTTLAMLVGGGTVVMFVAALTDPIWTLLLIGVGYATLETSWVISDARLQERLPPTTRATVTSVRSFLAAITTGLAFALIGLLTDGDDPTPGILVALSALAATAVLMSRWIPDHEPNAPSPALSDDT